MGDGPLRFDVLALPGLPAAEAPHSVTVSGPRGRTRVPVVLPAVQSITVTSPALGGYADPVYVVLPPGYASHPGQRYPVLYLLHGFPGQPVQFLNIGQVATTEATLVAAGRMKPMILVIPAGTRSLLTDEEWANGIRPGNGWETFIARDLVHAIDARYRTIPGGRGAALPGCPKGATGPSTSACTIPASSVCWKAGQVTWWRTTYPPFSAITSSCWPTTARQSGCARCSRRCGPTVPISGSIIGVSDPLTAQNSAFAAELTALGVPHHFFLAPGRHNWGLWRGLMPQSLIVASEHLSHG